MPSKGVVSWYQNRIGRWLLQVETVEVKKDYDTLLTRQCSTVAGGSSLCKVVVSRNEVKSAIEVKIRLLRKTTSQSHDSGTSQQHDKRTVIVVRST